MKNLTYLIFIICISFFSQLTHAQTTFTANDIAADDADSIDSLMADLNGDTFLDIYVANRNQQNNLWINDGAGNFTAMDIVGDMGDSRGIAIGDLNGDTFNDIYVANLNEQNKIWINDGVGNFTAMDIVGDFDVTIKTALGDIDNDSDIDIYNTNDVNFGQPNNLWINDGMGNFTRDAITDDSGGTSAVMGDVDGDGSLDIYVTTEALGNKLYINDLDIPVEMDDDDDDDDDDTNVSSRRRSGGRRQYTCSDPKAENYNRFGAHKQSLCEYRLAVVDTNTNVSVIQPQITNCSILTQKMKKGDRDTTYSSYGQVTSSQIVLLQKRLGILSDGIFGPMTAQSVKTFQQSQGLLADGVVGPQTLIALNKKC